MDLNEISVFVQIVKSGSLTKACQALRMPKATVSRRLKMLEERLGVTLLQRTTRQLQLTRPGQEYFQTCSQALQEIADAEQSVLVSHDIAQGKVRMTTPAEMGIEMASLLTKFSQQYPLVQLEIDLTNRQVNLVQEGFDLALRAGVLSDSSLKSKKLWDSSFVLVASPSYLSKKPLIQDPHDLKEHRCISFSGRTMDLDHWRLQKNGRTYLFRHDLSMKVSSAQFCKKLAIEGMGITFIPEMLVRESLQTGELSRVLPEWSGLRSSYHLVYPAGKKIPLRLRVLIDFLVHHLRGI